MKKSMTTLVSFWIAIAVIAAVASFGLRWILITFEPSSFITVGAIIFGVVVAIVLTTMARKVVPETMKEFDSLKNTD